ncbi:lysophospholipid acyltransferase family protein [Mesoaciditoga lauensis]|uniref:lysophospholipid acyltransferase family protein n=1 Tax=Mesoaciditoga lauensis TaxID=1495039 RepID=UPI00055E7B0E|nr:lysophospholipid acyltransferase family protein [Mesoaciditoga lauensis]
MEFIRYIRIFIAFLMYMLYAPFFTRKASRLKGEKKEEYIKFHVGRWGRRAFEWAKSEVVILGRENIPKEGPYIIVANHRSMLDISLIQGYINPHAGFIAKKELDKFFTIGDFLRVLGGELIDRDNPRDAIKAISRMIKRMKEEKQVVAIFPEGTRSQDGKVHEFKAGSMKIILKSKVPVLPMAIVGTDRSMPKGTFYIRRAKIVASVLPPIPPERFEGMKTPELAKLLRDVIVKEIERIEGGEKVAEGIEDKGVDAG